MSHYPGKDYRGFHLSADTPVGTNASPVVDEFVSGPEHEHEQEQDGYLDPELAWFGAEEESDDSSKDRKKELEKLMAATLSKWKLPHGYEEDL